MADSGRWGCDRGEFTSTVHGKPPELWLPSRLQRLRSRVLKITSYSAAANHHPPFYESTRPSQQLATAFVIGGQTRPIVSTRSSSSFLSRAILLSIDRRAEERGTKVRRSNESKEKKKNGWPMKVAFGGVRGKIWKGGDGGRKCNFENASNRRWR